MCADGWFGGLCVYTVCIYILHIQVGVVCLGRVFRSFRFDGELYAGFVGVCGALVVVYAN